MKTKGIILSVLLLLSLGAADLGCYWVFARSQANAIQALRNADVCGQLAAHIVTLRISPTVAGTREQAPEELSKRIETIAHASGIKGDNLAAIEPDPAVRVADTSYLEKPTSVQLRQVTLLQLVNFLCDLSSDGQGLRINALRLTAPPHEEDGNRWSAEITVIYLAYSPLPSRAGTGERS